MSKVNKGFRTNANAAPATPSTSAAKTVKFVLTKTTKGACVYGEVDDKGRVIDTRSEGLDAANIGTLYLRKKHLGCGDDDAPKSVTVTIATA